MPKRPPASVAEPALAESDYRALGDFRYAIRQFLAFSEEGARALVAALKTNGALTSLKLSWGNSIGDAGAEAIASMGRRLIIRTKCAPTVLVMLQLCIRNPERQSIKI